MTGAPSDNKPPEEKPYTKIIDGAMPHYLMYGMTADEYLNGDNELPRIFAKAYELKQSDRNRQQYRQASYIYEAICLALSGKPFLDQPFPETQEEADERARKAEEEKQKAIMEYYKSLAVAINKQMAKKNKEKEEKKGA